MTDAEVLKKVQEILKVNFSIAEATVTPEATFRGTLGLDSLDVVDLIFFLQQAFNVSQNIEDYRELHTVGKLCSYIASRPQK
jgi:acyl carrier protein